MTDRTAEALIDTECHVLAAEQPASTILRQLPTGTYRDDCLLVFVDDTFVVGKLSAGQLRSYIADNPNLAQELTGNLADSTFATCRASDPEHRVSALVKACKPDVIVVIDAQGQICGAIRQIPNAHWGPAKK